MTAAELAPPAVHPAIAELELVHVHEWGHPHRGAALMCLGDDCGVLWPGETLPTPAHEIALPDWLQA